MRKFYITFRNALEALFKNFWFWFLCAMILMGNGTVERKIIGIIVLVVTFPLFATIIKLWAERIERKRKPPNQ